jgi:integrase
MDFQALLHLYLTKHIGKRASAKQYWRFHRTYFMNWTDHKTRFELKDWHESLAEHPDEANKALNMLRAMYGWAQITGDATGKKALWEGENPARGIKRFKTYSRERTFTDLELQRFFMFLDFHYHKLAAFLTVVICSACRMSEAREMQWQYVDYANRCWHKPTTKNGKSQRLPLPTQAIAAIQSMEATRRPCSPYIFQGIYGDRPWSRSMAEKAWRKAALDMGLNDLRLHDFRRTVASRVYEHTKDLKLVKAILNHFDADVTGIYVRMNYDYIARELQANADRFWALKQEVTASDVDFTRTRPVDSVEHPLAPVSHVLPV